MVVVLAFLLLIPGCAATSIVEACRGQFEAAIYLLLAAVVIRREFDGEGLFR